MSDQVAPAVVKVGALEAQAKGSAMDSNKINIAISPPAPPAQMGETSADAPVAATGQSEVPRHPEKPEESVQPKQPEKPEQPENPEQSKPIESKVTDTIESAAALTADGKPKPVQIQSVPETPANTANSINGTPRPELNLSAMVIDPEKPSEDEAPAVIVEPLATAATSAPITDDPPADKPAKQNGAPVTAEMTGALQTAQATQAERGPEPPEASNGNGKKHKLDDKPGVDDSDDKHVEEEEKKKKKNKQQQQGPEEAEGANKKAKIVETEAGTKTNGRPTKARPGRPRKDKSKPRVVGHTERKTRSQGPVEAETV